MRSNRIPLLVVALAVILAALGCAGSQTETPVVAPVPTFTFAPTAPVTGQAVTFTGSATNTPTSWAWTFGDGATSTVQSPTHTYTTAGTYTVSLTAGNAGGTGSVSHAVTVTQAVVTPVASFSPSTTTPVTGQVVTFTDGSTNTPTSWAWTFGDGATSTVQSPTHTYTTAGTYTVSLTATNSAGSDTKTQSLTVTQAVVTPVAAFSLSTSTPATAQIVTFTDTSSNTPTSWAWSFGDGTSSTLKSPTHAYTTAGTYTVSLTATNSAGSHTKTQSLTVTQAVVTPVAAFSPSTTTPVTGQVVTFTDGSTNTPTSWAWTFGDGATSTAQSPTHTYTTAGTYTVSLTATNSAGSNTKTQNLAVTPSATFRLTTSVAADGGTLPIDYTMDGSGASPDLAWSNAPAATQGYVLLVTTLPGDGTTRYNWVLYNIPAATAGLARNTTVGTSGKSSDTVVAWAPPQSVGPGLKTYTFTLYALSGTPSLPADPTLVTGDVVTQAISGMTLGSASFTLGYTRTSPVAGFTATASGLTATFTSACGLSTSAWAWSFGDGSTSTATNPSHTYPTAGTYTVALTATNTFGSSTTSKTVTVTAPTVAAPVAAFSFSPSAPTTTTAVAFTDASTNTPTSWAWSFGDGTTSSAQDPSHTYSTAGTYTVSLTATNAGGSNSTTKTVTVANPSTPAAAYTYLSAAGSTATLRSGHAITFTDTSTNTPTAWAWDFGDGSTSTQQNPVHIFTVAAQNAPDATASFTVTLRATNASGSTTKSQTLVVHQPEFNLYQGISDEAQSKTVSFSGFAMLTGNLYSQTFFPPGKVADYTGFQYLRDNDPSGMGHNTSFVTKVAYNVINLLTADQIKQLADLAVAQQADFRLYGYKRYTLMKAFRRLLDGNLPTGTTGLSLAGIKAYSNALYLVDGQISYDRAVLYANIIKNMTATQLATMDAMKGAGWSGWPEITTAMQAGIDAKMKTLPKDSAVLVMTYAGDIFSWYAGSVDADVYFCPERHGTYYGGFYMKDAPAIGHEGYAISTTLTAEAGAVLLGLDNANKTALGLAPYYITKAQADQMASLAVTQKNNLYAATTSIVSVRTQISTLLRTLLLTGTDATVVRTQVLALSGTYGELDGENNYNYAKVFASVYQSLTDTQKTALTALRTSIMKGTYSDGTPFDFSTCSQYYLYSDLVTATDLAAYTSDAAIAALFE